MKMTVLEMAQDILQSMESDEVTTIEYPADSSKVGSIEGEQVAAIIRNTYYDVCGRRDWKFLWQTWKPSDFYDKVFMTLDDNIGYLRDIRYNKVDSDSPTVNNWSYVYHLDPNDWLDRSFKLDNTDSNVEEVTDPVSGQVYNIVNDEHPKYWTQLDSGFLVFDGYDSSVDASGLEVANTMGIAKIMPTFEMRDDYIPPLPADMFPYLLAEAKVTCFYELKQMENAKEVQKSRKAEIRAMYAHWTANGSHYSVTKDKFGGTNYGRR
jgi:hypothetical protein